MVKNMENFKKKGSYKSIRTYKIDGVENIMAYAIIERDTWDIKCGKNDCGKSKHLYCHLDILCPNKTVEKIYQEINDNRDFCLKKEMIGCLKNFSYNTKIFYTNYDRTEIVKRDNDIYLRFSLCVCHELKLTDEELLEKIENSYYNVAEAIWEKHRVLLKEKLKNKKLELFDKLLDKEVDIEQIGKEYNKYSDELNEELMKSYEVLLKKPNEEIQVVEALKE